MKTTDFARHLTDYLSSYLPGQRNLSSHTIASYRDTFKLLLIFCDHEKGIPPESLTLAHVNDDLILAFITWIETARNCSISTRNQRLAAIHAFFRYIQAETPERLLINQRILAIPFKKTGKPAVSYLSTEALASVLKQPNTKTSSGRRDLLLLTILYDSGARVSELTDLLVRDVRLTQPATVTLKGKGRKVRHVPIMSKTASLANEPESVKKLEYAGIDRILVESEISGNRLAYMATQPNVVTFLETVTRAANKELQLEEVEIPEKSWMVNKTLKEISLPSLVNLIVISIQKKENKNIFNPRAETKVTNGDVLIVLGEEEKIGKLKKIVTERGN